ncbi:23S rRNA (uracil(1939)-C(5))-methyltransferase RlmD [Halalkalibacterium halodurans]|uniref:23S rRNA (uracil(1939)-C(5))-methyltransferase RlmD n=1 Tax=Halalkalibacterium halodurans TaxID=86665 RepID=UPI002E23B67B|nr:23S rRNA (uracil(1939)-C(5))-methyltransferase RlmD [Halalkalibacterium halodurans]MED3646398.1 23S rRNA (uracil(1939)-C(5))-methyltransferase RlmD [Halalkalibacterium halodurans]
MTKQATNAVLKKGQRFPLTIKRLGINGEGVGYFKRHVVFVPGALPGEEVVVEVTDVKPRFAEASIRKIRKSSPDRISPPCPVYDQCGGCQLQHLSYEATLKEKREIVKQAFERHTTLRADTLTILPTIGMEDPWAYRNKSQLQLKTEKGQVKAGLYAMNTHKLVDLSSCLVQHDATNEASEAVKQIVQDLQIPTYNERKRTGILRSVVSRVGFETGELQVILVTTKKDFPKKNLLVEEIKRRLPHVKSLQQNINPKKTSLIMGDETISLFGEEAIEETLGDISFSLSARAFFQLNPKQTVKLYNEVKRAAALTGKEKVIDAYCGVGTIGLWLANQAKEVRGMDVIAEAIEDAKENAKRQGITNVQYEVGKAEKIIPAWVRSGWIPDVIVVDPPRTGCDDQLLKTIKQTKPKRIVYVSCNPSTLAKDVEQLQRSGYKVKNIQPVDMFPWTAHVECVALMSRVDK